MSALHAVQHGPQLRQDRSSSTVCAIDVDPGAELIADFDHLRHRVDARSRGRAGRGHDAAWSPARADIRLHSAAQLRGTHAELRVDRDLPNVRLTHADRHRALFYRRVRLLGCVDRKITERPSDSRIRDRQNRGQQSAHAWSRSKPCRRSCRSNRLGSSSHCRSQSSATSSSSEPAGDDFQTM